MPASEKIATYVAAPVKYLATHAEYGLVHVIYENIAQTVIVYKDANGKAVTEIVDMLSGPVLKKFDQ